MRLSSNQTSNTPLLPALYKYFCYDLIQDNLRPMVNCAINTHNYSLIQDTIDAICEHANPIDVYTPEILGRVRSVSVMKLLLDVIPPTHVTEFMNTPDGLMRVVLSYVKDVHIAQFLIDEYGANVHGCTMEQRIYTQTPPITMVDNIPDLVKSHDYTKIIDLDEDTMENGQSIFSTPLVMAIKRKNWPMVKLLIDNGAASISHQHSSMPQFDDNPSHQNSGIAVHHHLCILSLIIAAFRDIDKVQYAIEHS